MSWTSRQVAATFQRMVDDRHRETGRRIAQLREARGWSQEVLAHEAKVSTRTVSRMENGEHDTRGRTLRQVADALGVPVGDLVPDMGSPDSPSQLDRIELALATILARLDEMDAP